MRLRCGRSSVAAANLGGCGTFGTVEQPGPATEAAQNLWLNMVFGAIYRVIMILVIRGGWHCYVLYGLIEIALTVVILWDA